MYPESSGQDMTRPAVPSSSRGTEDALYWTMFSKLRIAAIYVNSIYGVRFDGYQRFSSLVLLLYEYPCASAQRIAFQGRFDGME